MKNKILAFILFLTLLVFCSGSHLIFAEENRKIDAIGQVTATWPMAFHKAHLQILTIEKELLFFEVVLNKEGCATHNFLKIYSGLTQGDIVQIAGKKGYGNEIYICDSTPPGFRLVEDYFSDFDYAQCKVMVDEAVDLSQGKSLNNVSST